MEKLKKTFTVFLVAALFSFALTGCLMSGKKEPLKVKKVSYLVITQSVNRAEFYVITDDRKVTQYSITPEGDKTYDYFAGELPPEDNYKITEYEIDEQSWESVVNELTRVDFMILLEEFPPVNSDDGSTYYIQVETEDGIHKSGGYEAGFRKDPENRKFSDVRQCIAKALQKPE